jgi:hypothetical protein
MEQPTKATQLPGSFSDGHLRLESFWDTLRGDPRFEKLVASLAPGRKETVDLNSAEAKADVADGLNTEAFFELSQDFDLGDLFQLIMQRRLEDADVENAFAQCHGRRVRGDKFADNIRPGVDHLCLVQTLAQSEPLHDLRQQLSSTLKSIWARLFFGKTAPFGDYGGTKRRIHG